MNFVTLLHCAMLAAAAATGGLGLASVQTDLAETGDRGRMEELLGLHKARHQAELDLKTTRRQSDCPGLEAVWADANEALADFYREHPDAETQLGLYLGENPFTQEFLVQHGLMEDPERARRRRESRQELEMLALAVGQPDHPLLDPTSPEAQAIFPATCYQLMQAN